MFIHLYPSHSRCSRLVHSHRWEGCLFAHTSSLSIRHFCCFAFQDQTYQFRLLTVRFSLDVCQVRCCKQGHPHSPSPSAHRHFTMWRSFCWHCGRMEDGHGLQELPLNSQTKEKQSSSVLQGSPGFSSSVSGSSDNGEPAETLMYTQSGCTLKFR